MNASNPPGARVRMTTTPAWSTPGENRARPWIARAIHQDQAGGGDDRLPALCEDYDPSLSGHRDMTSQLVSCAAFRYAAVITGPGEVLRDFTTDGEHGEHGYHWFADIGDYSDPGQPYLRLAGIFCDLRYLRADARPGAEAALAVLRHAVDAGNDLLRQLRAYCTRRQP
jgi:hypothetical protein